MRSNRSFGNCIELMLSTLEIRNSTVARALNVDTSLVNRWIHGKRVPPYRSGYIDLLTEVISSNILNSYQEERLNIIISKYCNEKDNSDQTDQKSRIRMALREAQGISIEEKKDNISSKQEIRSRNEIYSNCRSRTEPDIVRLSEEDRLIFGIEKIMDGFEELFDDIRNISKENNNIHVTLINDAEDLISEGNLITKRWDLIMKDVLKSGWNIHMYFRINNDLGRTIRFIRFIQPMLSNDGFIPYYFNKYDFSMAGRDIVTVPGIAAVILYSGYPSVDSRCGFFLRTPEASNVIYNDLISSVKRHAIPLVRFYTSNESPEFLKELDNELQRYGDKMFLKDGLSILTLPKKLYMELMKGLNDDEARCGDCQVNTRNKALQEVQALFSQEYYEIRT
jgi:hypothetical protein